MHELVIARADDWVGLYVDGHLLSQGHSFPPKFWISAGLDNAPGTVVLRRVDQKWLESFPKLPDNIGNVKWKNDEPRDDRQLTLPGVK